MILHSIKRHFDRNVYDDLYLRIELNITMGGVGVPVYRQIIDQLGFYSLIPASFEYARMPDLIRRRLAASCLSSTPGSMRGYLYCSGLAVEAAAEKSIEVLRLL